METKTLGELLPAALDQLRTNSTPQLKSDSPLPQLRKTDSGFELSLYTDDVPKNSDFKTAANRLSIAFPKMTKEFFLLLTEFVAKEKFTAKRLEDSVNHVIANFQYKELNISDIMKFDRRAKLYTYLEVCEMWTKHRATVDDFEKRRINGTVYWVKKTDLL